MPRRSSLVPACLAGVLLLVTACSGEETPPAPAEPDAATQTSAGPAPGEDGAGTTSAAPTGDDAQPTTTAPDPGDGDITTAPPSGDGAGSTASPEPEAQAAFPLEEVEPRVEQLLGQAADARAASGGEARELRDATFTRVMRLATFGEERLRAAGVEGSGVDPFADALEANVLAVSRDDGQDPWVAVAQTTYEEGNPQLHLVRGAGDVDTSWLSWSAEMLPGTEVGTFDPRGEGSPVLRDPEDTDLRHQPEGVLRNFATYLDYPRDNEPDIETGGYAPQVRINAQEQADEVAGLATLEVTNAVDPGSLTTVQLQDGSAMAFATIERTADFTVNPGSVLTPPEVVGAFLPEAELTEYAQVDSLVFAALHIPSAEGGETRPQLIAVSEQVIGAEGD